MKSQHHIEETQLDQMLGRHQERAHDHISFLVSPPCFATNFMRMEKFELACTADEAQGSTSRTVAGEKGAGVGFYRGSEIKENTPIIESAHQERGIGTSSPDFYILSRPHIVRPKEEVHMIFCSGGCERVAHGKCDCGVPLCNNCRYLPNGERSIFGDCKECSKVPQDSAEVFSNGRQV